MTVTQAAERQRGVRSFRLPANVKKLLSYPIRAKLPLSVKIESYALGFHSRFAESTDIEKRQIVLEELFPAYGNELLAVNKFVTVECVKGNYTIAFSTAFEKTTRQAGHWLWRLRFPETVQLRRLRRYSRVEPRPSEPVTIHFDLKDESVLGRVVDISMGGVLFASKITEPVLEESAKLTEVRIKLPTGTITTDAVVRKVVGMNCALEFTSLAGQNRDLLADYIEARVAEIRRRFVV